MSGADRVNEKDEHAEVVLPPDFSAMLDKVLANPQILTAVASALSQSNNEAPREEKAEASENGAVNGAPSPEIDAMAQKLPQMMKAMAPLLSSSGGAPKNDKRACLLSAIKPYLNPARCEAIDYIIRFSQLSEVLKTMK